ncbi:transposase domain-containing protein [Methylocystis sp. WRRC1]|nr:transposase domain-containing protein [Methylocystis sp. WRRC1]MCC3245447.1 transposase domain-containing protein [Methylocystis sp. WRRC1]
MGWMPPPPHQFTYMADVLTKIGNGHLMSKLDELMPWAYAPPVALKDVA